MNECPAAPAMTFVQVPPGGGREPSADVEVAAGTASKLSAAPMLSAATTARGRDTVDLRTKTASLSQRRRPRPVTDQFAVAWRAVEKPLRNYLGSLGLAATDIDDVVQETAIRAIENAVYHGSIEHLRRWAFVVARRLSVDLYRSRRRMVAVDEVAERDIQQEEALARVEDRQLLRTVLAAVASLSPGEQSSFAPVSGGTVGERNRRNVARHRARKRLRYLVGPIAVTVAWARRQWQAVVPVGGAVAAAVVVPLVTLPHSGQHATPDTTAASRPVLAVLVAANPELGQVADRPRAGALVSSHRTGPPQRPTAPPPAGRPPGSISASGPADAQAMAWNDDKHGNEALLCIRDSDRSEPVCTPAVPRGIG